MTAAEKDQIARLATEWALEVAPTLRNIRHDPKGTWLEQYVCTVPEAKLVDDLTTLLYITIDEARQHKLASPLSATELDNGPRLDLGRSLKWLIHDTQVVAAPYPIQRQAIPERFVVLADEVALEFSDRFEWFLPGFFLHGLLMERQVRALTLIQDWLGSYSGQANALLWTEDALQTAPEWSRARELARQALAFFGVEPP